MTDIEVLVHQFIDLLHKRDVANAVALFAVDGVYQEAGASPFVGHIAIDACLRSFVALERPWNFIVDEVIQSSSDAKAAVVYRFLIESERGEQLDRAGCALVKLSAGQFVEWREYMG